VHTSNVFFETTGGPPILGDFGLVHDEDAARDLSGAKEGFGPWRWRPPELKAGSPNTRDPASDLYLMGGLIYEALTGGEHIESTQRDDGSFVHELEPFSLTPHSADARIPLISKLLRGMLAVNSRARITSAQLLTSIRKIRGWRPNQPAPVIVPSQATLASLAERARLASPAYHAERIPPLLLKVIGPAVGLLVERYPNLQMVKGTGGDLLTRKRLPEIRKHDFTSMITFGKVEASDPLSVLEGQYPGFYWGRAWMKVFYGPEPQVDSGAWVFVGRNPDGRQLVVEVSDNLTATVVSESYADDPMEEQTVLDALEATFEVVTARAVSIVERSLRQS
jgi:serine/threonine protein kinase